MLALLHGVYRLEGHIRWKSTYTDKGEQQIGDRIASSQQPRHRLRLANRLDEDCR